MLPRRDWLVSLWGALTLSGIALATEPATIPNFSLKTFRGNTIELSEYRGKRGVVLAFLGTECPLAKLYGARLEIIAREYEPKGFAFIGIDPNSQDSLSEMAAFAAAQEIAFPLLKDPGATIAELCGATRTPEVVVIDSERKVRYRGRIDDQYGIGASRKEPTTRDLIAALDALLVGREVDVPRTEAEGCLIGKARTPREDSHVSYSNQIVRLLNRRCVECHREGDVAPFPLTTYEQASGWAEMMLEVVNEGRMPPWHASPDFGHFEGDRRLSPDEKRMLREWVQAGAPRGNSADLPAPLPAATSSWHLPKSPDLVVKMSDHPFKTPAEGVVRYQYFVVPSGVREDRWIQAVEVRPGNRSVVHHVLVFARPPPLMSGEIDETAGFLGGYVPGLRVAPFPPGMAKKLPAHSRLIFQVHYTPNGREQNDVSEIGFVFTPQEQVTHEVHTVSAVNRALRIPPGARDFQVEADSRSHSQNVELLSFMPHMHLRGQAFRYEAVFPSGKRETLLDVPKYDFNWQTSYRFEKPRTFEAGTHIHCTALFDNSSRNQNNPDPKSEVRWGKQTWQEMMIGYFDVAVARNRRPNAQGK